MDEKYCPACGLVHREDMEICCNCEGRLVERPESSDGEDRACHICIREDKVEMA